MKKSIKLFTYLLFSFAILIVSCEHCDDSDADNQAIYNEKNLENSNKTINE